MNVDHPGKAVRRNEPAQKLCARSNGSEPQAQAAMATAHMTANEANHPSTHGSFSLNAVNGGETDAISLSEPKPAKESPEARVHVGGRNSTCEANSSVNRATIRAMEEKNTKVQISDASNRDKRTLSNKSNPKEKTDRTNLRKGKWTVEEEEYASRIIHYYSTGLLTTPEGSTLRSFLAGKLNCDPMRITKKFAGTYSWGKRAHRFRDRLHSTHDIEMAKADLAWLERRFHLRVKHGQSGGMPVLSSPAGASDVFAQHSQMTSAAASAWLQSHAMAVNASQSLSPFTVEPIHSGPVAANASPLPGAMARPERQPVASYGEESVSSRPAAVWVDPPPQQPSRTAEAVFALAEAAASLTPAFSQLAAANLYQLHLQQALQAQLQFHSVPASAPSIIPSMLTTSTFKSPKLPANQNPIPCSQALSRQPHRAIPSYLGTSSAGLLCTRRPSRQATTSTLRSKSTKKNQVEGSVLAPLKNNVEDSNVEPKEENQDSSDGQTSQDESELFASYSTSFFRAGKGGYVSASEESEREQGIGPPTKRFNKRKRVADLTSSNVQEHNSRWDARHRPSLRCKLSSDVTSDHGVEHG